MKSQLLLPVFFLLIACQSSRLSISAAEKIYQDTLPLPEGATARYRLLQQTAGKTVIDMTITKPGEEPTDQYLYFTKEKNKWLFYGTGSLTLIRPMRRERKELETMTAAEIDSMSKAAYDFRLNSLKLKMGADDSLVAHFNRYKDIFDQLKNNPEAKIPEQLLISNITTGDLYVQKGLCFHVLYDAVGYLYLENKKHLPEMWPDKVMMLRELDKGWYLYKVAIYLN